MKNEARITLRLPVELKDWLDKMKDKEFSSINFEIVRSVRERKARLEEGLQA